MYRRFHQRFGTAGLLVAIAAFVLAIGGTALAASGALTGKQKKEVEKIAKKYAGKPGAPGAPGTNGTNGKDGAPGTAGSNGKDGKSVVLATITPNATCEAGGTSVEVEGAPASKQNVCNGKEGEPGETGPEGALGTAGTTLPPGATETGGWAFNATVKTGEFVRAPISFTIPLAAGLDEEHVHFQGESGFSDHCKGETEAPKADSGHLCVYNNAGFGGLSDNATLEAITTLNSSGGKETNKAGSLLLFTIGDEEPAFGFGSWAVTG